MIKLSTLLGVPAHPLLVHIAVVFTPLAALGTVAIVLRADWRRRYGWLVVAAAFLAFAGTELATGSGEKLRPKIDPTDALRQHIRLARTARPLVFVFFVLVTGYVAVTDPRLRRFDRLRGHRLLVVAAAVVTLAGAAAATTWMVLAGHQGAKVTWSGIGQINAGS